MSDESDRRLRDLFANALELTDPQKRERYLAEACGQDAKLRQTLEGLLSAHQEAGGFLKPTIAVGDEKFIGAGPGTVIGRYKLVEEIGEGGFGRVFMAEQAAPVRRTVALKIVKVGMDTREVVSRFEAERMVVTGSIAIENSSRHRISG